MDQASKNPYANIEKKWQDLWYENNLYAAIDNDNTREKKYILVEFPYPSGSNLHVGHCFRYTVPDVYSRFMRMRGYNVLFPIGWDAFGLPTEEYARKTGINPKVVTKQNVDNFRKELKKLGFGFDWGREFATSDPEYYKWTQWIFGELYKSGLAEQKEVELWWCQQLGTVLANEEIIEINGQKVSERGEYPVERKKMTQWILKMPEYAEELLSGLEQTNFPEHIKDMQRHWIGKSEGVVVDWKLQQPSSLAKIIEMDPEKTRVLDQELAAKISQNPINHYSSIVFLNTQRQILVMRKSIEDNSGTDLWELPSGYVVSDESVLQGTKRIAFETAGLEIAEAQYIDCYNFVSREIENTALVFYSFTDKNPILSPAYSEYKWVSHKEALGLLYSQNVKNSITKLFNIIYPSFADKPENIDFNLEFGERSLAIIKIRETGEFVVYDKALRNDFRVRFPGGHIDEDENSLLAAIREVEEESGLVNLEYIGYLGTSHGFYDWAIDPGIMIHKLDHFHYFECSQKDWDNRGHGLESNISCFLATEEYVRQHSVSQFLAFLDKIGTVKLEHQNKILQTFTTRVDTIYSVTFLVIAPENPRVLDITTPKQKSEVLEYIAQTKNKTDLERQINQDKTGVFTGSYVFHPLTRELVPVWVSDFVLPEYGTGVVMADAHDERDYNLALKYDIELKETIAPEFGGAKPNEIFVEGVGLIVFNPSTQKYGCIKVKNLDKYYLIGGGINNGETWEQAAVRELAEETGLTDIKTIASIERPFYSHYFNEQKNLNRFALTHVQLAILNSDLQQATNFENHENFDLIWGTAEEIINKLDPINKPHQIEFMKMGVRQAITGSFDITNQLSKYPLKLITEDGILYDSNEFNGLKSNVAREEIADKLVKYGRGRRQINYKFRDWVFSRQRYWGEPFPFEYIKKS